MSRLEARREDDIEDAEEDDSAAEEAVGGEGEPTSEDPEIPEPRDPSQESGGGPGEGEDEGATQSTGSTTEEAAVEPKGTDRILHEQQRRGP